MMKRGIKIVGKLNGETIQYKMFAFLLSWGMIQQTILLLTQILDVYDIRWYSVFSRCVLGVLLVFIGYELFESPVKREVVVLCLSWIILFGISIGKYSCELQAYISDLASLMILSFLSIIICFSKIKSIKRLEQELCPYICVMIIYSLLNIYFNSKFGGYSMNFSYHAVFFALLSLVYAVAYGKKIYYIPFLLYCISNLCAGSRGSFLCIIISFILIVFIYGRKANVKIGTMLGVSVVCVLLIFKDQIIDILSAIMGYSRTLLLLRNGELFYMSGRDEIYNAMRKIVFDNLFSIKGFYADRIYLCDALDIPFSSGMYAHNIVYEVIYDFGGIGVFFLIFLLYCTVKHYNFVRKPCEKSLKNLYIISVSYAFGQLFISSSYLIAPSFGILIASYLYISNFQKGNFKAQVLEE